MVTEHETINFKILLDSIYWNQLPMVKISVDQQVFFNGAVDHNFELEFSATLSLHKNHCLIIDRYGKTTDQTKNGNDQLLIIKQIDIDQINAQDLVWNSSYFVPHYPEPWASQQKHAGIMLEDKILSETCFGHNGTWMLNFTSPFYMHIINRYK